MIFTETVLPKGSYVYKGLPRGIHVLRRTKNFFVTTQRRVASAYGRAVATYQTTKSLRLFVLNNQNMLKVLNSPRLSRATKLMLRFALGTRTTRARQHRAYRMILRGREALPGARNARPGQRLSVSELDRQTFEKFSREFLIPERYDGYYAPSKPSIFHGGRFHAEVMVCNPVQTLRHVTSPKLAAPVRNMLTHREVINALPSLFVEYSRRHIRLLRPYGGFVIYLGGGMAVKLYLEARAIQAPPKVLKTTDFDFTFSVTRQLRSKIAVRMRVLAMKRIMMAHLNGFTAWLGRFYNVRPQLLVKEFVPPVAVLPTTGKRVYHVVSYALRFPGVAKPVDFIDTTLAHVPGLQRDHIHYMYSKHFGMPIERLKYLSKNVLAVLAGSFATKDPSLKSRNPLVGNRAEKGLKNTARMAALLKVKGSRPTTAVRQFVKDIQTGKVRSAFKSAKQVLKNIRKI